MRALIPLPILLLAGCANIYVERLPSWATAIDEPQTISPPLLFAETEYDSQAMGIPTGSPPAGVAYAVVDIRKTMPQNWLMERLKTEADKLRADYVIVSEPGPQPTGLSSTVRTYGWSSSITEEHWVAVLRGVLYRVRPEKSEEDL